MTDKAIAVLIAIVALLSAGLLSAAEMPANNSDWPQFRGPNRDGVAVNSPKLMDSWPKEGPPLVWKSDWIQGSLDGGCGHPVVAGGKVFVYTNAKLPSDGGDGYRYVTTELLVDCGWLPDLPEELSKKIEAAWASASRPSSDWRWSDFDRSAKEDFNAYLQKKPDLDKYIKDFLAPLPAQDAEKYGDYIRKRLGKKGGVPWETLVKLSPLRETRYRSSIEWLPALASYKPFNELFENSGRGLSSPTIRRLTKLADSVVCLDAATGKTLWRKDFPMDWKVAVDTHYDQWCMFGGTGANCTPAVVGDKCYVSGMLGLYCLSVKDGAMVWRTNAPPVNSFVLVADGVVYESANGSAYHADTGALLWKNPFYPGKGGSGSVNWHRWNAPLLWSTGGKKYIISTDGSNGFFSCLELQTGKVLWTEKAAVGWFPTLRGDLLMLSTPWPHGSEGLSAKLTGPKLYKLTLTGPELIWKGHFADTDGDLIYGDHLYMYAGCMDLKSGEVNWRAANSEGFIAPPILADGKLIQLAEGPSEIDGPGTRGTYLKRGFPIVMFKATPEKYVKLGEFRTQACSMCSPAFSDGKIFLRLHDSIACYDLREHGVYLEGVAATQDALTFQFKQTGSGLAGDVTVVLISGPAGTPAPAKAHIQGERIVVDIKDVPAPFEISCAATNTLTGKNGKPVPAFGWNTARTLKIRKCIDRNIILASDLPLLPDGGWNQTGTYIVSGAQVTDISIDSKLRTATLTTDKIWKPGDILSLTYACFPVERGEPRRETLKHTVVEPQRPAVEFVKTDETTSGNWKGVYGKDGAVIAGDKASAAPQYAVVTVTKAKESTQWAPNDKDERHLQKSGEAKNRTVQLFNSVDLFDVAIDFNDDKEHQVAAYCFPWGNTIMTLEVLNPDTGAVLDTQTVEYKNNKSKYLVWNIKGAVILRFIRAAGGEGATVAAGGVFFDSSASATTK